METHFFALHLNKKRQALVVAHDDELAYHLDDRVLLRNVEFLGLPVITFQNKKGTIKLVVLEHQDALLGLMEEVSRAFKRQFKLSLAGDAIVVLTIERPYNTIFKDYNTLVSEFLEEATDTEISLNHGVFQLFIVAGHFFVDSVRFLIHPDGE